MLLDRCAFESTGKRMRVLAGRGPRSRT
jgi:hypothetical protein